MLLPPMRVQFPDSRALRRLDDATLAVAPGAIVAATVSPGLGAHEARPGEMSQGRTRAHGLHHHGTPNATVPAVRPTFRDELLPPKGDSAIATAASNDL